MVSWAGNGDLVGYDPTTHRLKMGIYKFASSGTVNLNGITRVNFALPSGVNTTTYPNRIAANIPMTFQGNDFVENPNRDLSVAMFVAWASSFPTGKVPTPAEILALPESKLGINIATKYWKKDEPIPWGSTETMTFNIPGPNMGGFTNQKFWALVIPVAMSSRTTYNKSTIKPLTNINVNSFGRAVSLWSDRTPAKPTITLPASGTVLSIGETTAFSFTSSDPDAVTPVDANKYNSDIAAVHVQYAPVPTADNPSPVWQDIIYRPTASTAFYLNYSAYITNITSPSNAMFAPMRNQGFTLRGANDWSEAGANQATLPGGEWQIRMRTAGYEQPHPELAFSRKDWPAGLVYTWSPWSNSVRVSVPTETLPPIPLHPTNGLAMPDNAPIELSWQYRNTRVPVSPQFWSKIELRDAGEEAWHEVVQNLGAPDGALTTDSLTPEPNREGIEPPAGEYVTDLGFEQGTLGGNTISVRIGGVSDWSIGPGDLETPNSQPAHLENVTGVPPASHSGTHYLDIVYDAAPDGATTWDFNITPKPGHRRFAVSMWLKPDNAANLVYMRMTPVDADGNELLWYTFDDGSEFGGYADEAHIIAKGDFAGGAMDTSGGPWTEFAATGGWAHVTLDTIRGIPSGTAQILVEITMGALNADATVLLPVYNFSLGIDDVSVIGSPGVADEDPPELSATREIEWRVGVLAESATDTNFQWSAPARFWIVPSTGSGETRPVPEETIEGATLGCGTHRAFIYRRGGKTRVGEIKNLTSVDWSRVRDDISTAQVVVADWDVDCGNLLANLQTWAYELVIYRNNGYSQDRVWEGPITLITYERDSVSIQAKDVMGYAYRRIIRQEMNDAGTGHGRTVVDRAVSVLQNAFAPDDPNVLAYLTPLPQADDSMQYRSTPAFSRSAFEEIDDMAANAGLDYTTIGRSILVWGTKHRIGTLPEFRDDDLGASPIVSEYGMSMANRYAVSDGNGVHGEANRLNVSGNDPVYGLVEMLSSTWASDTAEDSGTYTQAGLQTVIASFEGYAETSIADRYPPPVVVRVPDNTALNPGTALSIQQLVPGVAIPLRSTSTLRTVVGTQKLDSVKVTEQSGRETITVTLSPFSRDDAAMDEGEGEA